MGERRLLGTPVFWVTATARIPRNACVCVCVHAVRLSAHALPNNWSSDQRRLSGQPTGLGQPSGENGASAAPALDESEKDARRVRRAGRVAPEEG